MSTARSEEESLLARVATPPCTAITWSSSVLKAKTENDIPRDAGSRFEKILHDKMDVESWRKLVKWSIDYEYVLFWMQAMDPRNAPEEPWPAPFWDGPKMIMPQDLYHKFIEENIP